MIVQSLARYYDILAGDDTVKISRPGYSLAKVSFALVISPEGVLTNILDLRTDGKKNCLKEWKSPCKKAAPENALHPISSATKESMCSVLKA